MTVPTSSAFTAAGYRLADFILYRDSGVHVLRGAEHDFGYRDGAERYLYDGLGTITDLSTGSEQVASLVHDWASLYHLTPYRATIFDCLGLSGLAVLGRAAAHLSGALSALLVSVYEIYISIPLRIERAVRERGHAADGHREGEERTSWSRS